MKVTFVYPRFQKFLDSHPGLREELPQYFLGSFTTPPSLGIPFLAAYTPPEVAIELVDDNSGDSLDPGADADLIAINCFTPQAEREKAARNLKNMLRILTASQVSVAYKPELDDYSGILLYDLGSEKEFARQASLPLIGW